MAAQERIAITVGSSQVGMWSGMRKEHCVAQLAIPGQIKAKNKKYRKEKNSKHIKNGVAEEKTAWIKYGTTSKKKIVVLAAWAPQIWHPKPMGLGCMTHHIFCVFRRISSWFQAVLSLTRGKNVWTTFKSQSYALKVICKSEIQK